MLEELGCRMVGYGRREVEWVAQAIIAATKLVELFERNGLRTLKRHGRERRGGKRNWMIRWENGILLRSAPLVLSLDLLSPLPARRATRAWSPQADGAP